MDSSSLEMDLSNLPKANWWGDDYLYQVGGFWLLPQFIQSIYRVVKHFKPIPSDIILASYPKTGTTWLKSLVFSIIHRCSKHRLSTNHPHELIPTLEVQVYATQTIPCINTDHQSSRIFSTHIPYQLLSETLDSSECRVVYVTRNPKDTLVSTWHFVNKWDKARGDPWPLDVAIDKFCDGETPCGPYYDHVMGYKRLSLERPKNVFFVTYEELRTNPITHVKKLAEFLGCPFEGEDEEEQVQEVVNICSFEVLSNYEVNKSEDSPTWFQLPYNSFFRKGNIGDHTNYLNDVTIERIDALTREKFHSLGFMYGT
ncbi:cytosolic sulfotransferase 17-like [Salvia miltiorrhiza]|uniref:cytosolic sulfotransferase 17-like n=1 Tax=Salvia miltiorrhiza TaxID=226208 RepID=UPI0025AD83DA|nr:cytosolic sulfotransferase 17-like [Salvia miltiorrhiza]